MTWLIVEKGIITNMIVADEDFAKSIGAVAMCLGADIGKPYPTTEQLRADKLAELNGCCSAAIASGVTVNKLHYTLTSVAQHDLSVMAAQAKAGTASFLYHADGEAMRVYTADEIIAIAAAATEWVTVNTTYYDLLKVWVARETDPDKLGAIKYGSKLPDDLMTQLADLCKSVGIDVTKYSGMFAA